MADEMINEIGWNPWHGCKRFSSGCKYCYVFRMDERYGRDPEDIHKNRDFDLPVRRNRSGDYKVPKGTIVDTCFTSDFLLPEADQWRPEAFRMMKERSDLQFYFFTKRIERFSDVMPADWEDGYDNVRICCTVEDQKAADKRMPIFRELPIKSKGIVAAPLLEGIDFSPWVGNWVDLVSVGGESGPEARVCDFSWVQDIREQWIKAGVPFVFHQTGASFKKDGKIYFIKRKYQHTQARKAGLNWTPEEKENG